jgi:hypothetical protein
MQVSRRATLPFTVRAATAINAAGGVAGSAYAISSNSAQDGFL